MSPLNPIKRLLTVALVWLLAAGPLAAWQGEPAQGEPGEPFSLQQCIDYALQNSTLIQNADLERQISQSQVGQTRAQGLPQVNIQADLTDNYAIQQAFVPRSAFPDPANPGDTTGFTTLEFGAKYTGTATLSAQQLIFDGSYFVGLQAAKTFKQLAEKDYQQSKIDVVENVTKAYYSVLVNQERLSLTRKNFQRLDSLYKDTRALYEEGFAEKIDVDRIKVNLNNLQTELGNVERLVALSFELLKFQMNMPLNANLLLTETIEDVQLDQVPQVPTELNYMRRPDFAKWQVNYDLALLDKRNNQSQYLPQLNAFFRYGYNIGTDQIGDYFRFGNNSQWLNFGSWGLQLNVPVFDGLLKRYRVQQNKLQAQQLQNQISFMRQTVQLEVKQSQTTLQNSVASLKVQRENLQLAEEVFRVTKIKYEEGVGSNLEVLDAETALKQASTNYYSALFDALIAKVDLEKALGILYEE